MTGPATGRTAPLPRVRGAPTGRPPDEHPRTTRTGGARQPDRRWALAAVCLGFFMVLLDGSALNIALPSVRDDLDGSMAGLQWVVNIYTIPLASVLLTAGSLSDRLGARRVFTWSLAGFTAASLLCSLAPTLELLVAARALQGFAAGGLLPTTLAIIAHTYPDPVERARAITAWGATGGTALVLGPLGGGALTGLWGWRAIFLINVPVGLVTWWLAVRHVRETPKRDARPDLPGQIWAMASLGALVSWLIEGGELGWGSPAALALMLATFVCVAVFVAVERRSDHPMLPLAPFRDAAFSASIANGFAFQFGGYGLQFMLAIYVQQRWGLGPARTGLLFVPFAVAWVFGTLGLNRRLLALGHRRLLVAGSLTSLIGTVVLFGVADRADWPVFVAATLLVGLGCGVFSPSLNAAALHAVAPAYSGLGSGILNTARQIGMAVGVALLGAFIAVDDALFGLRVGVALVALSFLAIAVLSARWLPRAERS